MTRTNKLIILVVATISLVLIVYYLGGELMQGSHGETAARPYEWNNAASDLFATSFQEGLSSGSITRADCDVLSEKEKFLLVDHVYDTTKMRCFGIISASGADVINSNVSDRAPDDVLAISKMIDLKDNQTIFECDFHVEPNARRSSDQNVNMTVEASGFYTCTYNGKTWSEVSESAVEEPPFYPLYQKYVDGSTNGASFWAKFKALASS